MLKLAIGKSAFRKRVELFDYDVTRLFRELKKPIVRKTKDGPYMVLAEFKDLSQQGDKYPHSIRNAQNLIKHYGAVLDLDKASLEIDEIGPLLPDCKYFIYTTFSHQLASRYHDKGYEPTNRYRVVIPYDAPVSLENHKLLMASLSSRIGIENVDSSTGAVSRPMYLPAMHPTNADLYRYKIRTKAPLMKTVLTAQEKFELSEVIDASGQNDEKKFDINEEIYEGQGRNDAATRLVGKFIHNGMDNDTLVRAAETWNEINCKPPLSRKELHVIIKSIVDGHGQRSGKWGFDEIKRRIQTGTVDDFDQLIKIIASVDHKTVSKAKREILTRELSQKLKVPITSLREEIKQTELLEEEVEHEEDEKKERKTTKELRQEFKHWVYVSSIDKVFNLKNGILYKPEGFNRMHQSKLDKGSVLPLLLKYNCIQHSDRIEFAPGEKDIFSYNNTIFANTYRKIAIEAEYAPCKLMINHFRLLIPDASERNIILNYIAFLVQKPGKKVMFMPIIKGGKGIGKSAVIEKIIRPILGDSNVRDVKPKKVKQDFNAWQMNTQLICFHELKLGSTRREKLELTEELKDLITERHMQASLKGVDDYDINNKVNMFALTNHEDAIMITPDERRFFMVRSDLKFQSREYYNELHTWLDENPEAIYHYFLYRDIEDFDPHFLPESKYTEEVKQSSFTWPRSVLQDALTNVDHFFNTDAVCTWQAIVNYVRDNSAGRDAMECDNLMFSNSSQSYRLNNALKDSGLRKYETRKGNTRIRIGGKLETIWLTPLGIEKHQRGSLRLREIKECLNHQQKIFDFNED